MYLTPEIKKDFFKKHGKSEFDTGSTECQATLFTYRIQHLTEHMKKNKKDFFTEKSLVALVSKRKKLLNYLKDKDITRYRKIIAKLKLRK